MAKAPRPDKPKLRNTLKTAARQMRKEPTQAEEILWQHIRNRQIGEAKFRRQHSIDRFVVDFYCAEANLVIEVDGPIHIHEPNHDQIRQKYLEDFGLCVIRFSNEQVLTDLGTVIKHIEAALSN